MLTDDALVVAVRTFAKTSKRLTVLLLLAHVQQPAKPQAVRDKGHDIGFRGIAKWDVADILGKADRANLVTKREGGWVLLDTGIDQLRAAGINLDAKAERPPSDSIIPRELVAGSRSYLERIVHQINGSYDQGFYDCCAVMCRRLIETLIIEVYEADGRSEDIKAKDGHFHMLNGLLGVFLKDKYGLGRNTQRALEALKALGDKSAHSRRFNARQADIDPVRADLRAAAEELMHLAKLA